MSEAVTGAAGDAGAIRVRELRFALTAETSSHLCPGLPEFSHVVNAFMAALPQLEPYFIHNIRETIGAAVTPQLKSDIALFVSQEARHAQQHRALNELLAQRYPELPVLERAIKQRLDRSRKQHSLAFRMAYTAGYEAITYQLVGFMMDERATWLAGADPHVLALLCWHGAEEVEHKSVAYDAFQAVHGGYFMRVRGLLAALVVTVKDIKRIARYMLEVDGTWHERATQRRLWQVRGAFARGFLPRLFSYFLPGYHPSRCADPPSMIAWLERYAAGEDLSQISLSSLDEPPRGSASAR